ncbi:hypothetical protein H8959_004587 [Pygathrix nigripes]
MWQPATERLQHFQTMLKSKLNVLTLKKEPLPAVIFHEPEAIELCTTTPLMKTRTHSGCKAFIESYYANYTDFVFARRFYYIPSGAYVAYFGDEALEYHAKDMEAASWPCRKACQAHSRISAIVSGGENDRPMSDILIKTKILSWTHVEGEKT